MADSKITALTADTSPTSDDLIVTVNDPAGTPANRKVTLGDAITKAHGLADTTVVGVSSGVIAAAPTTGSGNVVLSTSPTLVTPVLGAATATSVSCTNGFSIGTSLSYTAGGTTGTIGNIQVNSLTSGTGLSVNSNSNSMTGKLLNLSYSGTSSGNAAIMAVSSASATGDTLKISNAGSGKAINVTAGNSNFAGTITTGAAAGTTGSVLFNGTTSGTVTLSVADAAGTTTFKLPTADGSTGQFMKTDGAGQLSFATIPGGGDALTTNPLSQFAATTSSQLAGVISDETGTNKLVFSDSPTLVTPILGTPTSGTLTNCSGLPVSGITASTSTALGVGSIELGHATDTTIARVSAGVVSIEGANILVSGGALGTPSSGTVTNLTGTASININGTVGATTPTTVAATTVTTSGQNQLSAGSTINLVVPTSDGTATGPVTNAFNSGYSSTAVGDLVYLDSSSTWQKADNTTSTTTKQGMLGIALEVKSSGQAVLVALPGSYVYAAAAFPTFTIGAPIYMSTAGTVTQTQPSATDAAIRIIGWGVHADKMYFNPSPDYITHT